MNKLATCLLLPLCLTFGQPLPAQAPATGDCLSDPGLQGDKMEFFICLNAKREACQDQLLMIQSECGQDSPKYKGAFTKYLELRSASNMLLDVVIAGLRFNKEVKPEQMKALVEAANEKYGNFQVYCLKTSCAGETSKFFLAVVPAIASWATEKAHGLLGSWFSGGGGERKERAEGLFKERWKSPPDFGATFPTRPHPAAPKA